MKVNHELAEAVATEFERLEHAPDDPDVKAAYDALKKELVDQYEGLLEAGYTFDFYPEDGSDPYPNSPREAILDLLYNKHMLVYPTEAGFGMDDSFADHPLMEKTPYQWGGRDVYANDLLRAVHDAYGHGKEALSFRADGEDNAYRQHAAMFSPLARKALATETRGQNHWVNYGPNGAANARANQADTVYADQKAAILPDWAVDPDLHRKAH